MIGPARLLQPRDLLLFCAIAVGSGTSQGQVDPPETALRTVDAKTAQRAAADRLLVELQQLQEIAGRVPFPVDVKQASPYEGRVDDHEYLRAYVTDYAMTRYGVPASLFEEPTIVSTGILRDLVHKFNFSVPVRNSLSAVIQREENIAPIRKDIAETWRYPSRGVCGQLSFTLFNVYRALGYHTNRISEINGQVGPFGQGRNYSNSHVVTEVYIPALECYVIQDSTFNSLILDARTGAPVGWLEAHHITAQAAKTDLEAARSSLRLASTWVATGYPNRRDTNKPTAPANVREAYATDYLDIIAQVQSWDPRDGLRNDYDLFAMFRSIQDAHGPKGRGETTGFELIDLKTGKVTSRWKTIRLDDGTYRSMNRDTGQKLNGSYDQLASDALNGDLNLNPGVDLSEFLGLAHLFTLRGRRMENPLIRSRQSSNP